MGIDSRGYGGREVPQSAVCKLETQESWQCNSVRVQRADGISPELSLRAQEPGVLMSGGRRRWMFQLKQREKTNLPFVHLFVLFKALSGLNDTHPHWGGPPALLSSPI